MIALQDKYSSKIKIASGPLQLIAVLKAKIFTPKAFCDSRKLSYARNWQNWNPFFEVLWCNICHINGWQEQSFFKQTLNEEENTKSQSHMKWQTLTSAHSWFNANTFPVSGCHQFLWEQAGIIDTAYKITCLATAARKITHHQHIREIHQHTGSQTCCLHSGQLGTESLQVWWMRAKISSARNRWICLNRRNISCAVSVGRNEIMSRYAI